MKLIKRVWYFRFVADEIPKSRIHPTLPFELFSEHNERISLLGPVYLLIVSVDAFF